MILHEPEKSDTNKAWIVIPEIVPTIVVMLTSPYFLIKLFLNGHILTAILGFLGWATASGVTILCLKRRQYILAILPMVAVLVVGLLINRAIQP